MREMLRGSPPPRARLRRAGLGRGRVLQEETDYMEKETRQVCRAHALNIV